jgi:predicted RNA-binding Zn ribbon-like protein
MTAPSPKPAPPHLRLVQEFVNTLDIEDGTDELETAADLGRWCAARSLAVTPDGVTPADLAAARELREALRGMLEAHTGVRVREADVAAANRVAARAALIVAFDEHGVPGLAAAGGEGVAGALARIVADVYAATLDGSWERLKACRADDCRWAFYDRSRSRTGQWCDMDGCGSRAKVRAYRARNRAS